MGRRGGSPGVGCADLGVVPLLALFLIGDAVDGRADHRRGGQGPGEHEVHARQEERVNEGWRAGQWHTVCAGRRNALEASLMMP